MVVKVANIILHIFPRFVVHKVGVTVALMVMVMVMVKAPPLDFFFLVLLFTLPTSTVVRHLEPSGLGISTYNALEPHLRSAVLLWCPRRRVRHIC